MSHTFRQAFRTARLNADITYREIAKRCGLSISYLCDIEAGRKWPPSPEVMTLIEEAMDIRDGHLMLLGEQVRKEMPSQMIQKLIERPILCELIVKLSAMSDERLSEFLEKLEGK